MIATGLDASAFASFLAGKGTSADEIAAAVTAAAGSVPGDRLLAVGSVVEGLGNRKSDLDLLLVTSRVPDGVPGRGEEISLAVGRCLVDVRVLDARTVEDLLCRLDAWSAGPWNVTHPAGFSVDERTLLHRLGNAVELGDGTADGSSRSPGPRALSLLKLHVARHLSRTIQVDMVGYREAGDHRTLVFASQELLGTAADALVACHGLTNPSPKWRSRLLDRLPATWERDLAARPTGLSAVDRFWRLHRAPEIPERPAAVQHALDVTAFSRAVFVAAERRLVATWPAGVGEPVERTAARRAPEDLRLPCLDFDVDYATPSEPAATVAVGRLNEFGRPVQLPSPEFALLLLFDGVTTAAELPAYAADELVHRVRASGLAFSPEPG